jgi:hypothetical protein
MKRSYSEVEKQVLLRILELSEETAPVQISLGYVSSESNQCCKGIVIRSAPSKVIKAIVADERVFTTRLDEHGLHVETHCEWGGKA